MKTSSKLTVAVLTTLVVGGTSAGSIFSSVLKEGSSSSLGTAGAFFSTLSLPENSVSTATVPAPKSDEVEVTVASANPIPTLSLVSTEPAIKIRTLPLAPEVPVLLEVSATAAATVTPEPLMVSQPESSELPGVSQVSIASYEPEPTVVPEPEVSPTSSPTPELTLIEEPSQIEP